MSFFFKWNIELQAEKYLSDRCVLLEKHGSGRFQLDGGSSQDLQGPEAHLKQDSGKDLWFRVERVRTAE